jgi:hypothetical protein
MSTFDSQVSKKEIIETQIEKEPLAINSMAYLV